MYDTSDLLYVHLDRRKRRRKFLVTTFLRALGYSTDEDIIKLFYTIGDLKLKPDLDDEAIGTKVLIAEIRDTANADVVVARAFEPLTQAVIRQLLDLNIKTVKVIDIKDDDTIIKCLKKDPTHDTEEALKDIYRRLRPGDPPTVTNAKALLKRLFFDPKRYDIGRVGRYKINQKLTINVPLETRIITNEDIVAATQYVINLRRGEGSTDDIDHLGSRRVRTVGELLANQCRTGLSRTERLVKERMTLFDVNTEGMTPQKLINPKALSAVIRDFFGRSQLSQFMDQTNPLAELTHKRRLSALGPGGLSRDRAGFEVRDVHPSHYGRICPIETPEGPNIGLISSMSCFSRINEFGFIETPYRKVDERQGHRPGRLPHRRPGRELHRRAGQRARAMATASSPRPKISVRYKGDFLEVEPDRVSYMDVSLKQLVSVAASLIPFLEHDDANRALMGSNMQRQGVPLIKTEAPLVGTGMEGKVARDSKAVIVAEGSGKVASVTGNFITITPDGEMPEGKKKLKHDPEEGIYVYELRKYMRSNAGTCMNQKPLVKKGQKISKGQVIADGPCTDHGELALGRNVLVAFMPWNGYNFEDAILISEKIVKEDIYTSIHIEEYEITARDTKLGPEEITRDIPNVGDEALRNLGTDGVVRIGAEVKPGDILVGKITPKSETELAPEERLLRAIFGEKAADVKDSSLTVPSGTYGIIMDVKVTSGSVKAARQKLTPTESKRQSKAIQDKFGERELALTEELTQALSNILLNEKIPLDVVNAETGEIIIPANRKITKTLLRKLASVYDHIEIDPSPIRIKIREIISSFESKFEQLKNEREVEMDRVESGDDIDPGIVKQVKVFVASQAQALGRRQDGRPPRQQGRGRQDRARGRHALPAGRYPGGNRAQPARRAFAHERRPGARDPSRHRGQGARLQGRDAGVRRHQGKQIREYLKEAGLSEDGKSYLYDGRTGERFDQRVVVGQIYMLKLGHLVADKIHARAVGPYSLVTQQPLGGKAQYGGQRFGEMEVWAMEAYGAAYTLQELLTVKSDDVPGRTRIYESIVKGDNSLEAGTPESFNVLIKEMQSLGLDVKVGGRTAQHPEVEPQNDRAKGVLADEAA